MVSTKRAGILGLLAVASAGLSSCSSSATPPVSVPAVPVAAVSYASIENDLVLTAEFRPYQEVDVMAKVAGYVKAINVDIGDHVRQNAILAILEVPEIEDDLDKAKAGEAAAEADVVTAQAAVDRDRAAANLAEISFQRIRDVATRDRGLVPRQEVDVAQSRDAEAAAHRGFDGRGECDCGCAPLDMRDRGGRILDAVRFQGAAGLL